MNSKFGRRNPHRRSRKHGLNSLESLERRELLASFGVTSLESAGEGSLRAAIIQANTNPGPDSIVFEVAGTVQVGRNPLPVITDPVLFNGLSAPSYGGSPTVMVDFQGTRGLTFQPGSDGSSLLALSLVRAGGAGVTLNASGITVSGNLIGVETDGLTAAGNRGDGIRINPSSRANIIGQVNPVTSIDYYNADAIGFQPVSGWQGIRNADQPGEYLITGTSNTNGLLYIGPISGSGGTSYAVNYPGATSTSVYGPDNLGNGVIRLVGSYKDGDGVVHGFAFQGTVDDLNSASNYETIDGPSAQITYVHSTMGGLAVGNHDGPEGDFPIVSGRAFLFDLAKDRFIPGLFYPGATTTSAYGIWQNHQNQYTIAGGYTTVGDDGLTLSHAYLVDFDAATGLFSNWTTFEYPTGLTGETFVIHFQGISSDQKGVYTLAADSAQVGSQNIGQGSIVSVRRNPDGSFAEGEWVDLNYPGAQGLTSANSVAGGQAVGIIIGSDIFSYQASVNVGFQLSNVISANRGNGIGIYGSTDNVVSMNNIGTDPTGTLDLGNSGHGILMTLDAARNLIGGQATGGNDPTGGVFVRPPQGNLISANRGHGVLMEQRATQNVLSGNFIGTTANGNSRLGNHRDGVAIVSAHNNQLIGCTFQQSPFVFYNVMSGNGGNGVRIHDSNNTVVQANFMGVGANNASVVANQGNGLLVSGRSTNTQVGGVIPLGNVISGNNRNGIEVKDRARGFISFNTFAGLYAFSSAAPNQLDGIRITSTGGNNIVRTSIVSGNLGNGIHLGGHATGVQITETAIGTNTNINAALPNGLSGVLISGHAHDNVIGGFQPSIEPEVTISANGRYGVEIIERARNNSIVHSRIGTSALGTNNLGNALGGILLSEGTSGTTIGGSAEPLRNLIRYNGGNGITVHSSRRTTVLQNVILENQEYGLRATGANFGSRAARNVIALNGAGNVDLTGSRGFRFLP